MAGAASTFTEADDELPRILMATIVASIRSDSTDLSLRQLAVFLKTYREQWIGHRLERLATYHAGVGSFVGVRSHQT